MPAPTTTTNWADNLVPDATYGNNKVPTSTHIKDDGLNPKEPLARPYLNYQLNSIHQWIEHIVNDKLGTGTESVLQAVFPIGSYYMSGTSSTNPNTTLGFGIWVAVSGKFLVGFDSGQIEFDTVLETGGHKTLGGQSTEDHVLTESEIPSHTHGLTLNTSSVDDPNQREVFSPVSETSTSSVTTDATGGGLGHNHDLTNVTNLPPYEVCYMWRRTA